MQRGGRFFDDISRLMGGATGTAGGLRSEIEGLVRERVARLMDDLELVRRDEFEAVREMAARARAAQESAAQESGADSMARPSASPAADDSVGARLDAIERRLAAIEAARETPTRRRSGRRNLQPESGLKGINSPKKRVLHRKSR